MNANANIKNIWWEVVNLMKLIKSFEWIDRIVVSIAMASIFIMMIAVTFDAILRSVFNTPIVGVFELVENYLMVAIVFLGLSYTMKKDGFVRIDLFVNKLPRKISKWIDAFVLLIGLVLYAIIGYQGYHSTVEAYVNNYIDTGIISWPVWLSLVWVPLGSLLLVIRLVIQIIALFVPNKETMLAEETLLSKDMSLTDEKEPKNKSY